MRFSRQKYWSGLPCPPPGDLPYPGIEPQSLMPSALAGGFFTTSSTWEAQMYDYVWSKDHSRTGQGAVRAEVFPEELSSLYPQRIEEIIALEDTRETLLE